MFLNNFQEAFVNPQLTDVDFKSFEAQDAFLLDPLFYYNDFNVYPVVIPQLDLLTYSTEAEQQIYPIDHRIRKRSVDSGISNHGTVEPSSFLFSDISASPVELGSTFSDFEPILSKKCNTTQTKGKKSQTREQKLERNRQAAQKCRVKRKQWAKDKVKELKRLEKDNEELDKEVMSLRENILNIRILIASHKEPL